MNLKRFIPKVLKVQYQLLKRYFRDRKLKYRFALENNEIQNLQYQIELSQVIKPSHLYLNKIHNLKLGAARIESISIRPHEVFSFWKIIGQPNSKNGFKKGRNIVNNLLSEDFGGGLCQLSGIIFHIAILANLEIIERYNHSKDIYTDETRYSPLGCDATVVFGYKDLRIRNNTQGIIQFVFDITNEKISIILKSEYPIYPINLKFDIKKQKAKKVVYIYNENGEIISHSIYKIG